jgi:hypothetical protein
MDFFKVRAIAKATAGVLPLADVRRRRKTKGDSNRVAMGMTEKKSKNMSVSLVEADATDVQVSAAGH